MAHFYLDDTLDVHAVPGSTCTLSGPEARHAVSVSRLRVGESVHLGNGRGLMLDVTATQVDKDHVTFVVNTVEHVAPPHSRVVLVQALTKGDRDERAIEAATELGIDEVVPWAAERSVSVWSGSKRERGVERWATIVREAAKQSIRAFVPIVSEHDTTAQVCDRFSDALILVLDPNGLVDSESRWRSLVSDASATARPVVLIVGPEGGISPAELEHFTAAGAHRVRLGSNVLRSSTAGPAFLAAINGALGRW